MPIVLAEVNTSCMREGGSPMFSNTPVASSWPVSRK
jgi:hypothetical protein